MRRTKVDFVVRSAGLNLTMVEPKTNAAKRWLAEHTDGEWFGGALGVEPRFMADLMDGITGEGFTVDGMALH